MRVTVEWLADFVRTAAGAAEIGDLLTMQGLELERIDDSDLGPVLDFKVTPNRGDCLSVLGLARELCAKDPVRYAPTELFLRLARPAAKTAPPNLIEIQDPDLCPRYALGILKELPAGQTSDRIERRLTAAGMRPINLMVDLTNYVMLELGQPLHAFDFDKLQGGRIVVRQAMPGEKIKTLDGVGRPVAPPMLMICDVERPVAVAGVMGGEDSEITSSTRNILLESASFDPVSVRKTRKALGMSTEASYRFERHVDPAGVVRAIERCAELIREATGLDVLSEIQDLAFPAETPEVAVHEAKWNRLLGLEVPRASAAASLQALGCSGRESEAGLCVTPPTWRADLRLEEDFVEEIGRLWGYEKIAEALPFGSTPLGGEEPKARFRSRVADAIVDLGFTEVVNHTFGGSSPLDPETEAVELRNPAAPELAYLRRSLLPGISKSAAKNRGRALSIFEIGHIFSTNSERRSLGIFMSGEIEPEHWENSSKTKADFFAMKGVVKELCDTLGRSPIFSLSSDPRFRTGRRAEVSVYGRIVGIFGEISAQVAEELDLPQGCLAAEIDIDTLHECKETARIYTPVSQFPAVRRDLAFVIDKDVQYEKIESAIRSVVGSIAERVWLFDVFAGKGVPEGKHSLGVAHLLRAEDRTLTDKEANDARSRALAAVASMGGSERT
jgi:phenylalanyl-tRNA synthetase beta chain